jgi:hypothetical protein
MIDFTAKLIPPEIIPEIEKLTEDELKRRYV